MSTTCATGRCSQYPMEKARELRVAGLVHLGAYDEVMEILRALTGPDRIKATENAMNTAASISQWDFALQMLQMESDPETIKPWKVSLLVKLHRSKDETLKERVLNALSQTLSL